MNHNSPLTSISDNITSLRIQDYIKILTLRKWWIILLFVIGFGISIIYSYSLPNIYRSSTLIMVERQRIPETYVQSTIISSIHDRLNTISQQILSRTNLENIITKFSLYRDDDFVPLAKKLNEYIKNLTNMDIEKTVIQLGLYNEKAAASWEDITERLRNSIEVKVVGGNNAFMISYVGRDPHTVMDITNTLASLFIEENLRMREQQAEATTEFLINELAEAKRDLEKQERALKEFKAQHMGALPEQIDANLRTLDRLQTEFQAINNDLRNVGDRKVYYEQQLKEYEKQLLERQLLEKQLAEKQHADVPSAPMTDTTVDAQLLALERLREELTRLRAQFNENYPDVVLLKNQIREIEARLAEEDARLKLLGQLSNNQPKRPSEGSSRPQPVEQTLMAQFDRLRLTLPSPQIIKAQLQSAHSEIDFLRERQRRTAVMIREYEKRVEDTFANEQKLVSITRDYEMSQHNYQALLQKQLNARVAENLERRQKGEQFRILDLANLPQKPYRPNRPKIIGLGSLLSAGLGIGLIFVKEHFRPSYRKAEDFQGSIDLPALAVIPNNKTTRKGNRSLVTIKEADSTVTEQYRVLYTKLSRLNESKASRANNAKPFSVFAISSAIKNEGKTLTSLNLAIVTARDFNKKTLIIEGDLRNPKITTYLDLKGEEGLVHLVLNSMDFQSSLKAFGHDNLSILPAGRAMGNASFILSSPQMKDLVSLLRERFDYIFIDSPPILGLPDMNIIERFVDGVVLVVRSEKTPRDTLTMATRSLQTDKLIGFVLNDVRQPRSQYQTYYSPGV